ncbi:hypothetical protein GIB67_005799 [Kingdonia uniflora]|uniref:Uncharacterized protein n=1 Tax=Kingdonia uniflora TaxID=39325 RepID=A0A7J7MB89_9MAGN|nr:hypothetical protein GIB67_005799 [Kingdonia uniflora]
MSRNERDCDALIESKNQLEEELAMIKGSKATIETFGTEDMAEKVKDKAGIYKVGRGLRETLTKTKGILKGELGVSQKEKEKLKNLGKTPKDKPETEAVVCNEVVKISSSRDELKLELVKLKQLLAVKEAREQSRNPTNDDVDETITLMSEH